LGGEYKARLRVLWTSMVPYRSIEERTKIVSKGYNGETWEGCHNGQPIQIKVMNFKRSNIRSFAQQVVRLLSISHHNVVETLAASIDPEQPICLINRHYPEATYLSKYLKGNAFLSLQDRIDVCLQIAEALLFLHQQQPPIVLGDFNSTNVLIIDPRPKPAKTLAPPSKLSQEPSSSSSSASLVEEKTRLIVKVIIDNAVTETKIPALRSMSHLRGHESLSHSSISLLSHQQVLGCLTC
jgi:serine/threonine protein kinase